VAMSWVVVSELQMKLETIKTHIDSRWEIEQVWWGYFCLFSFGLFG